MAIRRINYTGRRRLRLEDIQISVVSGPSGADEIDARISLTGYDLPATARVHVEAYRQTSWMRFEYGTVAHVVAPSDRVLREFETPDGVLFRVKVSSPYGTSGLLLAEADRIRPRSPDEAEDERHSLLPVRPDPNLGDEVFRIDFSGRPLLLVNAGIPNWREAVRGPVFLSLAMPSLLREVLTRILSVEKHFDDEDLSDWRSQWIRYCLLLPGAIALPSDGEQERIDDWIDEIVASFCRRVHARSHFERYWTEGEIS